MVKEFSLPQELIDRFVDEFQDDHLTLAKFLLISRSFRDRARYHIFRVFVLYRFPDSKRKLITQIFTEDISIPPLVKSLHIYPFDPQMNIILPLLQDVNHIHLQTGSKELHRFIKDAQVLSTRASHCTVYGIRPSAPIRRRRTGRMSTSVTAVCTAVCKELGLLIF
ncbi:uncharacterized protein EV420DRAFT_1582220 [Desarmillaria tabescens]|uniref:F-box domain-containing protein n=1 Tax=Armillaria tabescens TaxID=1929756 RepID=A0AA39MNS4_ARMTA|nr:uncharacterized protein EV420DRAFT_1582220 [Desarmillaria tabescens]KAK0440210.1 hypothetical protein EV420DRAFT_1582220 [Desarmillaria tabescens]